MVVSHFLLHVSFLISEYVFFIVGNTARIGTSNLVITTNHVCHRRTIDLQNDLNTYRVSNVINVIQINYFVKDQIDVHNGTIMCNKI